MKVHLKNLSSNCTLKLFSRLQYLTYFTAASSFCLILDLTNLSRVFGLQNAARGGFGNTAFNAGDISIKRRADFNIKHYIQCWVKSKN